MNLLQFLKALLPVLEEGQINIHFAKPDASTDPAEVFRRGEFNHWQRHQPLPAARRRFTRSVVVSLIPRGGDRWLYAGAWRNDADPQDTGDWRVYDLQEIPELSAYVGRLVVRYGLTSRNTYRVADSCITDIQLHELHAEPLNQVEFTGYKSVHLAKADLRLVVKQDDPAWRNALSVVAGIYLITDTSSGQLYVGSAQGAGGIWQRWCSYAASGHGGNKRPRELLEIEGFEHADHFRFSILEIADPNAGEDEIWARESHWKRVLGSRTHGLNAN